MAIWNRAAHRILSALLPWPRRDGVGAEERHVFISSVRIAPRRHVVLIMDERGAEIGRLPLDGRGHDIAIDPARRTAVVFARRPGYFALALDIASCTALSTLRPPAGHHFFGHGVFSADGRLLYATENDFAGEAPRGVIGVYDVGARFARIGEFETHGMDAHEILLAPDGSSLVVANGGIETHPEFGRQKLNLPDMRPSIVRIDRATGERIEEIVLPKALNRLSMRHMTHDRTGAVWFGCQWEGDRNERPPLVGRIARDGAVRMLPLPADAAPLARNYIGSVAASRDGSVVATSSPIGGAVFLWDAERVAFGSAVPLRDGCGVSSPHGDRFLATSGDGRLVDIDRRGRRRAVRRAEVDFDNHLRRA